MALQPVERQDQPLQAWREEWKPPTGFWTS